MRTIRHIGLVAAAAALASPGVAGAATPRPSNPSVDQYIEAVPTVSGPRSSIGGDERVQPLRAEVRREVDAKAGSDAPALTKIATSSRYGAPVESKVAETGTGAETTALEQIPAFQPAENVDSRLVALVVFMAASLTGAAAFAWAQRRSRPPGD